jgi:guanosine-3',5'-bis(diphosphate) 3'-pyrophosphohydrolase
VRPHRAATCTTLHPEALPIDTIQLLHALHFAASKHRFQRRKDPDASPYINHPIAVAEVLARVGAITDPVLLMAALLHDTIEDTATSAPELEEQFGAAVRAIVEEVTDDKSLPAAERKRRQVEHAPHLSDGAKLVKLGDKICNVQDVAQFAPADWSVERRIAYLDWSTAVVAGCRGVSAPLDRFFDQVVHEGRSAILAS